MKKEKRGALKTSLWERKTWLNIEEYFFHNSFKRQLIVGNINNNVLVYKGCKGKVYDKTGYTMKVEVWC